MTQQRISKQIIRRIEDSRLVYYRSKADQMYWNQHWSDVITPNYYDQAKKGSLGYFENTFITHLPKHGRILEAGCGLGRLVLALRARGYDCEGVEWGRETVEKVRVILPELPIRVGDVTDLDVPDEYYQGYISLGVVEHRQQGPDPFLKEARRVLANDGVMLISVPYYNRLRHIKAGLGYYNELIDGHDFYQYAFTVREMKEILQNSGFRIDNWVGYDPFLGLTVEIPFIKSLFQAPYFGLRLKRLWNKMEWTQQVTGHMILFICRKSC